MAASGFTMTAARSTVVDYLPTIIESYTQMFIRSPAELYDWDVYALPLKWDAWLVAIIYCFLLPFIMIIIMSESK